MAVYEIYGVHDEDEIAKARKIAESAARLVAQLSKDGQHKDCVVELDVRGGYFAPAMLRFRPNRQELEGDKVRSANADTHSHLVAGYLAGIADANKTGRDEGGLGDTEQFPVVGFKSLAALVRSLDMALARLPKQKSVA